MSKNTYIPYYAAAIATAVPGETDLRLMGFWCSIVGSSHDNGITTVEWTTLAGASGSLRLRSESVVMLRNTRMVIDVDEVGGSNRNLGREVTEAFG